MRRREEDRRRNQRFPEVREDDRVLGLATGGSGLQPASAEEEIGMVPRIRRNNPAEARFRAIVFGARPCYADQSETKLPDFSGTFQQRFRRARQSRPNLDSGVLRLEAPRASRRNLGKCFVGLRDAIEIEAADLSKLENVVNMYILIMQLRRDPRRRNTRGDRRTIAADGRRFM